MSAIFWGFYLHVSGMKIGSSAEVGVGAGSFGVEGASYNWGGAGQGGCYMAINYKGSKRIYCIDVDYVSIQGQGFIQPAAELKDDIEDVPLNSFMNARFSLEVHNYNAGSSWKDVPTNLKLTFPHGTSSSVKEKTIVERNQLVSLKGITETATIVRGRLLRPGYNDSLWNACFGRKV